MSKILALVFQGLLVLLYGRRVGETKFEKLSRVFGLVLIIIFIVILLVILI